MNYDWTEEQLAIKNKALPALSGDVKASAAALENGDTEAIRSTVLAAASAFAGTGYFTEPAKNALNLVPAWEELAKISSALFLSVEMSARVFGGLLEGFGTDAQKEKYLAPVQAGKAIGAVAETEEEVEGSSGAIQTTAKADGEGYVIDGEKHFVTGAPIADFIAVVAQSDGGIVIAFVTPGQDGVTVGERVSTVGFRGMAVAPVSFKGVRAAAADVIGPLADTAALEAIDTAKDVAITLSSLGLLARAFEGAHGHSKTHRRGGKELFKYQEVGFKLAEMLVWHQTAQHLVYRWAWQRSKGDPEAPTLLACAKVFCSDAAEAVSATAMQIMAGSGYITGNPVEQSYRDAKYIGVAGTTNELACMAIADELLSKLEG